MDSIKRLREYVEDAPRTSIGLMARSTLLGMARDIELEVEQLHEREYQNGREDVTLWGVDYMPCPLDADGVPIHVGDVMEWDNGTFTVHELKVTEDGWTTWDEQHGYTVHADECRHHNAPTVEDVLREFAAKLCIRYGFPTATEETFAEYAAKLTLRGDE